MGEYWAYMARYNAETQTFSAAAGTPSSPFTPLADGKLIGIRVIVGSEAATSLTEGVRIRLSCTKWNPNTQEVVVNGTGLRTAPAAQPPTFDFAVDQPVFMSAPITIEGACIEATHVTNSVHILGKFKA